MPLNHRLSNTGVLQTNTVFNEVAPIGNWSNFFDGTGDYLDVPDSSQFLITGDFTVEGWIYPLVSSSFQSIFSQWGGGSNTSMHFGLNATTLRPYIAYQQASAVGITGTTTAAITLQWNHVAVTRQGSTIRLFVNGVQDATTGTVSGAFRDATFGPNIGRINSTDGGNVTGYLSNVRFVNGTALYTANFTPPAAPLTAIANTSLLTCQNHTLIDNSPNQFAITRNGDVSAINFSPYDVNWSNFFDGTSDYFTVPSNTAFAFGTGDFTIEFWVYLLESKNGYNFVNVNNSAASGSVIVGTNNSAQLEYYNGATRINDNVSVTLNSWIHVALCRNSGTSRLFKNGVQIGSNYSDTINCVSTNALLISSRNDNLAFSVNGYISNLRIVKGTAVYTSNFTPPTAPLTAIANTSLLTCQSNRFIDNSSNNFTITRNGNVRTVSNVTPFAISTITPQLTKNQVIGALNEMPVNGYWSNFFDGTGDYLVVPGGSWADFGSGDFTIECWFFNNGASTAFAGIISRSSGASRWTLVLNGTGTAPQFWAEAYSSGSPICASTVNVTDGQWHHIAAVRNGNVFTLYVDGIAGSTTSTWTGSIANTVNNAWIGTDTFSTSRALKGHISNLRVLKGTAQYTSNFAPPIAPLAAIANTQLLTCQSSTLIDNSTNAFALTRNGDVSVSGISPFQQPIKMSIGNNSTISVSNYFDEVTNIS